MLIARDQLGLGGLGAWYDPRTWFGPSKDQQEAAYQMTQLKLYAKQIKINRAKLDAARKAGGGGRPEYSEASHQQRIAESNFDQANATAITWYNRAVADGKVRPMDEEGHTALNGWGVVLEILLAVALVVVAIIAAAELSLFLAVVAVIVAAFAAFVLAMDALSRVMPAVGAAVAPLAAPIAETVGAGAVIALAVLGMLFLRRKGARA